MNITSENNYIRTCFNSAPVNFQQKQRVMVEPGMPIPARY